MQISFNYFIFYSSMASVRKKGKYARYDSVDEFILGKVAQHVYHSKLKQFAEHLKVSRTDYELITVSSGLSAKQQINEVWKVKISLQACLNFVDMAM